MKTTFLYFPGMFKNPAPAKYYLKKQGLLNNTMMYLKKKKYFSTFKNLVCLVEHTALYSGRC